MIKIGMIGTILILVVLVIIHSNIANAEESIIEINTEPKELWLSPDETKTLTLYIYSNSNETIYIGLEFMIGLCLDHPRGYFNESYFKLKPNESKTILLTVKSSPLWFKDEDCNDIDIAIYWGKNLSLNQEGFFESIEGDMVYRIKVYEDNTIPYLIIFISIVGITAGITVVIILLYWRHIKKKRKNKGVDFTPIKEPITLHRKRTP